MIFILRKIIITLQEFFIQNCILYIVNVKAAKADVVKIEKKETKQVQKKNDLNFTAHFEFVTN